VRCDTRVARRGQCPKLHQIQFQDTRLRAGDRWATALRGRSRGQATRGLSRPPVAEVVPHNQAFGGHASVAIRDMERLSVCAGEDFRRCGGVLQDTPPRFRLRRSNRQRRIMYVTHRGLRPRSVGNRMRRANPRPPPRQLARARPFHSPKPPAKATGRCRGVRLYKKASIRRYGSTRIAAAASRHPAVGRLSIRAAGSSSQLPRCGGRENATVYYRVRGEEGHIRRKPYTERRQ